ncbi:MAG: hypothetical protein VX267_02010, partial [Candidatus Thermoplasmatota archaeon]|nr:hypothetical protein [Candidatus Thermoplasmatota archaeon]
EFEGLTVYKKANLLVPPKVGVAGLWLEVMISLSHNATNDSHGVLPVSLILLRTSAGTVLLVGSLGCGLGLPLVLPHQH